MAVQEAYKNLTPDELEWADHYFESGNDTGLAKLRELSQSREPKGEYGGHF